MGGLWNFLQLKLVLGDIARSLFCVVLKKIGFNNTLIRNNIKNFSKSSMECSFCIWLARNKEWTSTTNLKVKDSLKKSSNSPSPRPYPKQNIKPVPKANSICPVGFIKRVILAMPIQSYRSYVLCLRSAS